MTGLEYMRTICPTTRVGKDPLREDVMDAFDDGVAEGWKQHKEQQWKPSEEQIEAIEYAKNCCTDTERGNYIEGVFEELLEQLKAL